MKQFISLLITALITLLFCTKLQAQSSQRDIDQVELTKKLIGSWRIEMANDSTEVWKVLPFEKGYEQYINYQAKGETYATDRGIIGFSSDYQTVLLDFLSPNGMIRRYSGKFISEQKIVFERYDEGHTSILAIVELYFQTPDIIEEVFKLKGDNESWDEAEVWERVLTRIKE